MVKVLLDMVKVLLDMVKVLWEECSLFDDPIIVASHKCPGKIKDSKENNKDKKEKETKTNKLTGNVTSSH